MSQSAQDGNSPAHRIPKMAEVIAAELRSRILNGELQPGESLYSEASLMEKYEVSRPTLREALRLLESQHLLTVRRGSRRGPVVSLPDATVAARSVAIQLQLRNANLADVYQFRSIFEPSAARMMAESVTEEGVTRLRSILESAASRAEDYAGFASDTWRFHSELVNQSGNATMAVVAELLHRISEVHARNTLAQAPDRAREQSLAVKALYRLVDIIESGDGTAAEAYWSAHMADVSDRLVGSVPGTSITELLD